MFPGVSPELLQQAHEIGKHVELECEYDTSGHSITLTLIPIDDEGEQLLPRLLEPFVSQVCSSFNAVFGIKGKVIKYE